LRHPVASRAARLLSTLALAAIVSSAPMGAVHVLARPLPAKTAPAARVQSGIAAHAMVAAANPLAVAAGMRILKAGGSAVDAAVAMQMVLGLVEPQSSGLGGGAFMVFYDAKTHKVTAYDGRETAPAGATPKQFLHPDGTPMTYAEAVTGGQSSGIPGAIAMLDMAQKDHGKLAWKALFAPAHELASDGFIVSPRLAGMITSRAPQAHMPDAMAYFRNADGTVMKAGDRLINKAYAASLDTIAAQRSAGLLSGPLAEAILARIHAGSYPSPMTLADMAAYHPKKTEGLCRPYRAYIICTPQAPSGGLPLQEAMGILEHTDIDKRSAKDEKGWYLLSQASRLAYADRDKYEGDPAFVPVPTDGLLAPDYLAARAALIQDHAQPVTYGVPAGAPKVGPDHTLEPGGTSHMVIVDADGNAVSMTTTVESIFGNGHLVGGFFMNNQLTDSSFTPTNDDGTPAANAVAPGKRPRSSMAPTIVLNRNGSFAAATGSPGGTAIVGYVVKALVGMLDWKMSPQDAVALPNLVAHGTNYSADKFPDDITAALAARGEVLDSGRGENSGLQAIVVKGTGASKMYVGGADPRREGVARGF
jgi:gamma-glutamyltranspeptidase/glutathione hydrolase